MMRFIALTVSALCFAGCAAGGGSSSNGGGGGNKPAGGDTTPVRVPAGGGTCGQPLVNGQSWCAVVDQQGERHLKLATFKADCTMKFSEFAIDAQGQATSQVDQFDGTWVLNQKTLTLRTPKGDGQVDIEVSANGQTLTIAAQTRETYTVCKVE
ncbi:MAG: hypothetical protein IPJ84_08650 [Bdellovibrionales bacterium]|nr:hypothetical protein [Bdellovibrionales bacterium]